MVTDILLLVSPVVISFTSLVKAVTLVVLPMRPLAFTTAIPSSIPFEVPLSIVMVLYHKRTLRLVTVAFR